MHVFLCKDKQFDLTIIRWLCYALILLPFSAFSEVKLQVQGLPDNIEQIIAPHLEPQDVNSALALRRLIKRTTSQMTKALKSIGYYKSSISHNLKGDIDAGDLIFTVELGPPVLITEKRIELRGDAKDDLAFLLWRENIPVFKGDIFNHAIYEGLKTQLRTLALSRGYFDADFSQQEVKVDLKNLSATIALKFDSGKRYRFGKVQFNQKELSESLLERLVTFEFGDLFLSEKITDFNKALLDSEFFDGIQVSS